VLVLGARRCLGGLFSAMAFVDSGDAHPSRCPALLRGAKLLARDATPYLARELADVHWLKVGDSALSIDPLSSQGVQTAIGTALHAAITINTLLDSPGLQPGDGHIALDFYRKRLRHSSAIHGAMARRFYREQYDVAGGQFWLARAGTPEPLQTIDPRLHPDSVIRLSPRAHIVLVPAATDRYVVATKGVELDGEVFAFLSGVQFADYAGALRTPARIREVARQWSHEMPPGVPEQILQFACAKGIVEILSTVS